MKLIATTILLALTATAHAGGKQRKKTRAVVDKVVGGKVVKRTVVIGNLGRRPGQKLTTEHQLAAMRKGWSVSSEEAAMPDDLTLQGGLVETGYREQRGGRAVITLRRPGAEHLRGERETRVYARGRVTTSKPLRSVRGGSPANAGDKRRGSGAPVVSLVDEGQVLRGDAWEPLENMTLHYDASDPYAVIFEAGAHNWWTLSRDQLATAIESGRGGAGNATFRVDGDRFEIRLIGVAKNRPGAKVRKTAVLRLARAEVVGFLRRSYESVPRGAETGHMNLDKLDEELPGLE